MKVLLLDQYSDPGGAQRMLLDLLAGMRTRGWNAAVGLPGKGEICDRIHRLGFETAHIDCGPYKSSRKSAVDLRRFFSEVPRLAGQIRNLVDRFDPQLVYINGPRLLPAAAVAHFSRPVLFHAHNRVSQRGARFIAGMSLRHLNARVVAVCEMVAKSWRPFAGPGRLSVIYNGVAGPVDLPARNAIGGPPRIGCVGRISPEKGQREFLEAAARIHRAVPDARFIVCGAPLFADPIAIEYERKIREAAAGMPVEFTGWVDDVYTAIANLDLLLVPSVWPEPNPRVVLEAFAAGLPVIAFRAGGVPEIIDHGRTGFLCGNAEEMAELTLELLKSDGSLARNVALAARESWRNDFTLERWQMQVLAMLERQTPCAEPSKRIS